MLFINYLTIVGKIFVSNIILLVDVFKLIKGRKFIIFRIYFGQSERLFL